MAELEKCVDKVDDATELSKVLQNLEALTSKAQVSVKHSYKRSVMTGDA